MCTRSKGYTRRHEEKGNMVAGYRSMAWMSGEFKILVRLSPIWGLDTVAFKVFTCLLPKLDSGKVPSPVFLFCI